AQWRDGDTPVFVPSAALGSAVAVGVDEAVQALAWLNGETMARPDRLARLGAVKGTTAGTTAGATTGP
ncbi:hypothetical protein G3N92_29475, partial [Burkholderia sp. Ac-20379]|nr:hypothetical protein [Burkholderia sp. Ac-20379]